MPLVLPRSYTVRPPLGERPDPGHPLARGLAAAWAFNEGGGQTVHDLVRVAHGNFQNSPSWDPRGIHFDRTQPDYIQVSPTASDAVNFEATQPFSVVFVGIRQASTDTVQYICSRTRNNTPYNGWRCIINDSANNSVLIFQLRATIGGSGSMNVYTDTAVVSPVDAAITYDGSTDATGVNFYYDGEPQGRSIGKDGLQADYDTIADTPLLIGEANQQSSPFDGEMGALLIYRRELSAREVRELHVNPWQMFRRPRRLCIVKRVGGGNLVTGESLGRGSLVF